MTEALRYRVNSNRGVLGAFATLRAADEYIGLIDRGDGTFQIVDGDSGLPLLVVHRFSMRQGVERFDHLGNSISQKRFNQLCGDEIIVAPGHPQACPNCGGVDRHLPECPDGRAIHYTVEVTLGSVRHKVTLIGHHNNEGMARRDYDAVVARDCQVHTQLIRHTPDSSKIIASGIATTSKEE